MLGLHKGRVYDSVLLDGTVVTIETRMIRGRPGANLYLFEVKKLLYTVAGKVL